MDTASSQCITPLGSSWKELLPGNSPEISRTRRYSLKIGGGGGGGGGGVRPGKCSWKIAAAFAYDVYEGFQRKEQAVAVATDLEDACYRVQFKLLMDLHIPWKSA